MRIQENLDKRNELFTYISNVTNTVQDPRVVSIELEEKEHLMQAIDATMTWYEDNPDAGGVSFEEKLKQLQTISGPLFNRAMGFDIQSPGPYQAS